MRNERKEKREALINLIVDDVLAGGEFANAVKLYLPPETPQNKAGRDILVKEARRRCNLKT